MPMVEYDEAERAAMVEAFKAPATGNELVPAGGALPSVEITDGVVTARKVEVQRDEGGILRKIGVLAAWAGEDWLYSYPVKNRRTGRTDTIEGLSIKGANSVARLWGNCSVDCRVVDAGTDWILYGR